MRIVAKLDGSKMPALLHLSVWDAPHRRECERKHGLRVIADYRKSILAAFDKAKIRYPIDTTVDLWIVFINPTSPDYDNLLTPLYRALDGATGKGPAPLVDDGRSVGVIRHIGKHYV